MCNSPTGTFSNLNNFMGDFRISKMVIVPHSSPNARILLLGENRTHVTGVAELASQTGANRFSEISKIPVSVREARCTPPFRVAIAKYLWSSKS